MKKKMLILILALTTFAVACQGNVFSLETGQCFNDPDQFDEVSNVETVDCTEAHDNEVFAVWDMTDSSYPGQQQAFDVGQNGCIDRFQGYVGRDYPTSKYAVGALTPSSDSWDGGDREVVCFLFNVDSTQDTASARNSGL